MKDSGLGRLRKLIVERYDQLKAQVAHRLGGSGDMAGDALHEAYVRLASRDDLDTVQQDAAALEIGIHAQRRKGSLDMTAICGERTAAL